MCDAVCFMCVCRMHGVYVCRMCVGCMVCMCVGCV